MISKLSNYSLTAFGRQPSTCFQVLLSLEAAGWFDADRSTRDQLDKDCAQQETRLAVLWTIGVFALNFGPVIVGGVLDWIGPKLTSMLGVLSRPCSLDLLTFLGS